jgi:hypothetical protein
MFADGHVVNWMGHRQRRRSATVRAPMYASKWPVQRATQRWEQPVVRDGAVMLQDTDGGPVTVGVSHWRDDRGGMVLAVAGARCWIGSPE